MLDILIFNPAIIVLTENWLPKTNKSMCNIEGYNSYLTIQLERRSGGVSVFVEIQCLWLDLFAVYRSHSETIFSFYANLSSVLTETFFNNENIILLGDLNNNILEEGNSSID